MSLSLTMSVKLKHLNRYNCDLPCFVCMHIRCCVTGSLAVPLCRQQVVRELHLTVKSASSVELLTAGG